MIRRKYGNKKTEIDGLTFDSKFEAACWVNLKLREAAGEISELQRQVPYQLAPGVVINGRKRPPLRYVADFVWKDSGEIVVADAKGHITEGYRIKRHLMKALYGVDIKELRK